MILLAAFIASVFRWLVFPVYDYPDAIYIYPRSPLYPLLSSEDQSLGLDINVLPASQVLSLFTGSVYDTPFEIPGLKYWLISSAPFLLFAILAQGYLWLIAKKSSRVILKRLILLFVLCPSSAYYLCTLHPEAWATVAALGYIVSVLDWVSSSITPICATSKVITRENPSLGIFIFFLAVLVSGFYLLGDYQFILCSAGIAWFYSCLRFRGLAILHSSTYLFQTIASFLRAKTASFKKLITLTLLSSAVAVTILFAYSIRELILSSVSGDSRIGAALSLYGEDSIYAEKYPLLVRPLLTLNNLFVFTPGGFGPSVFLKIACFWTILLSWFQASTDCTDHNHGSTSSFTSSMLFVLLFPVPIIFLLPGYSALKYYLFLVPVALFWPAMQNFKPLKILFSILWIELGFRSLIRTL
jgi:hypothetical protein